MCPMELDVRKLRERHGMTQEKLAFAAGLSLKTIVRVEHTGSATSRTLQALAKAFGVTIPELFEDAA